MFLKSVKQWGKISYAGFRSKLRSPQFTQIASTDEDLLRDVADNSINYCSNDLKILPDVVYSTDKRSSEFKKCLLNSSLSKTFPKTT